MLVCLYVYPGGAHGGAIRRMEAGVGDLTHITFFICVSWHAFLNLVWHFVCVQAGHMELQSGEWRQGWMI
jgi:hypothetical protein